MIFPVAIISAIFLISASLGSEESCYLSEEQEDQCASVCYPIVKPLLRYFEKSNERDAQLLKCRADYTELQKEGLEKYSHIFKFQQDYSDLVKSHLDVQNKYTEVLSQLKDSEVKYEQMINQKNGEIDLLKNQISDQKTTSDFPNLTNQFCDGIAKLGKIVKIGGMNENIGTKSEVETEEVPTTPQLHINNQTTPKKETIDFPDPCPRNQKEGTAILREIPLPGLDPFKVVCYSLRKFGSGWLGVYTKNYYSEIFNRAYEDYERRFDDVETNEFFIGLNRLHHLTSGKPHEVLISTFSGRSKCENFVVGDRSEGYKVKNIGNCSGYDWIIPKQGSKFSTFDRDEDGVPDRNLAEELDFGWWFDPSMSGMSTDVTSIEMFIRRTD